MNTGRRALIGATHTVAVGLVTASLFLPWLSTGRRRNGFELATTLGELGHTFDSGALRLAATAWFVCPASVGVALIARGLNTTWSRISAAIAATCAAFVGAVLWVQGSQLGMSAAGQGPALCAVASGVAAVTVLANRPHRSAGLAQTV